MSELIKKNNDSAASRWKLLTSVSALALGFYVSSSHVASAEESGRPQVWIELGGALNRQENGQQIYSPAFLALEPSKFSPVQGLQRPSLYGFDETGAISFSPEGSNWTFSASLQYGRTSGDKKRHQQTYPGTHPRYLVTAVLPTPLFPTASQFVDSKTRNSETHTIVDFTAGKDLGLGLFGHDGTSILSAGVRIAQFSSRTRVSLGENPDWHFYTKYVSFPAYGIYHGKLSYGQPFHSYAGEFDATRSFRGVGPSISWKNSNTLVGNAESGAMQLDWGVNAAVLFGRQKAQTHHQTTAQYHPPGLFATPAQREVIYQNPATPDHSRSRSVVVPNIGGFAGLSFKYTDAKVSFGYKADFFFGAMDGGIDTRKTYDRNFYGPFATVSIGLGG